MDRVPPRHHRYRAIRRVTQVWPRSWTLGDRLPFAASQLLLLDFDRTCEGHRCLIFAVATAVPFVLWRAHHEATRRQLAPASFTISFHFRMNAVFKARDRVVFGIGISRGGLPTICPIIRSAGRGAAAPWVSA